MKPAAIAGLVVGGIAVVCVIVIPCVLLIPSDEPDTSAVVDDKPAFAFDDIWSSKYSYRSVYPNWDRSTASQTDFISSREGAIERRDILKPYDQLEEIVSSTVYEGYNANGYSLSPDAKFIYYRFDYTKVWRHSYLAGYAVYDVVNGKEVTITDFPKTSDIQHMEWASIGHKLAFVHNFTVKMVDDLDAANPTVVTVSPLGEKNKKYFGIPDWMYEEEMISSKNVLYWNPTATKIAFLETNEDGVELIKYTWYGDGQYPETIEIAYPKAGTTISNVVLWVYDVASGNTSELEAPADFSGTDYYFSRFTWKNNETCLATWTNRLQTKSVAQLCVQDTANTTFTCNHTDAGTETVDNGWVGSFGPFYPMWRTDETSNDYFTIYARANDGDSSDGHWQLAYVEERNATRNWMTKTSYDIVGLTFYDSTNQYVYFTAAHDEARRRHILRVKATDSEVENPECMTCELMKKYPDRCGWVTPTFTDDGSKVVINCRGNMIPMTLLIDISADGTWDLGKITELETNDDLVTKIAEVKWPRREYGKFKSDKSPGADYNYEIWFPEDFDASKIAEYPLLIEVYAGPEFQKVTDTWRKGFAQTYMVSGRNMIVASVDGRGSAYQGYNFMRQNYLKLGQHEPEDQTDFARYLVSQYPAIDSNRLAIWGWSYGGYITSHTLGYDRGSDTFACGVAVAPLADWTWYDAMYAERYMGDVTANAEGYRKASIIKAHDLKNFKKSKYYLIHGTADDNVHFQSAAEMEKALVEADVDFDDFFYADEDHSINSDQTANKHVYRQIDIRLSYCLDRVDKPYGA